MLPAALHDAAGRAAATTAARVDPTIRGGASAPPLPPPSIDAAGRRRAGVEWAKYLGENLGTSLVSRPLQPPPAAAAVAVACGAAAPEVEDVSPQSEGGRIPKEMADELREKQERAFECLRFFYSCFPLVQRAAKEKAARLHAALTTQRDDLEHMKRGLPKDGSEFARAVMRRINALVDMIGVAIHRYDVAINPALSSAPGAAWGLSGTSQEDAGGWCAVVT